jgi:hypothetical protein
LLTWWPTQLAVSSCSALHVSVWFTLVLLDSCWNDTFPALISSI